MGTIKRSTLYAGLIHATSLGLAAGLLWLLNSSLPVAQAQGHDAYAIYYVAPGGDCGVGVDPCFSNLQNAVDAADLPADEIRVASGVYVDLHQRAGITQVVYLSKTVTIRGGYATGSVDSPAWTTSYPFTQPTTLDAGGQGRGLYIAGAISPLIEGLRITNGSATQGVSSRGGGVYIVTATATLINNYLSGNTATYGGGVYLLNSAAALYSNTITVNLGKWYGGGLYLSSSPATLGGNTISANVGNRNSGGLHLAGSDAGLYDNTITSNATTGYGGGVYLYASDAKLYRNTIASNQAGTLDGSVASGGGLAVLDYSDAVLDHNRIISNFASLDGGGVYFMYNTTALDGNTIYANTANQGGGLYLFQSTVRLTNTIVAANRAGTAGSGLYIKGSMAHMLHTTLADGDSSGIYVTGLLGMPVYGSLAMTNTILTGHIVGIAVTSGSVATLEATLWHANGLDGDGAGSIITGSLNARGDPAFANPTGGDYHIRPGSAAVDRGINAGVSADIDGQPRPGGLGYELGADELMFTADYVIYLPHIVKEQ